MIIALDDIRNHPLFPTESKEEWNKDHHIFVLDILLCMVRPRSEVERVIRWAYERDMEARSNGSNLVPDMAYEYGNIKDPMGVGHDWLFELHHLGIPDPLGHYWTLWECNAWYRKAWLDFHHPIIANAWWTGLMLGSWVPWNWGK